MAYYCPPQQPQPGAHGAPQHSPLMAPQPHPGHMPVQQPHPGYMPPPPQSPQVLVVDSGSSSSSEFPDERGANKGGCTGCCICGIISAVVVIALAAVGMWWFVFRVPKWERLCDDMESKCNKAMQSQECDKAMAEFWDELRRAARADEQDPPSKMAKGKQCAMSLKRYSLANGIQRTM